MSESSKQVWRQQEGEPDEAHARFLVYRNLGPSRSIANAAKSAAAIETKRNKTQPSSSQWEKDSSNYNWRSRAAKWDIFMLSQTVPETTAIIFEAIAEYARQTLKALASAESRPRNWAELRESVVILAGFVSPEIITAAVDHATSGGDDSARDASDQEETEV